MLTTCCVAKSRDTPVAIPVSLVYNSAAIKANMAAQSSPDTNGRVLKAVEQFPEWNSSLIHHHGAGSFVLTLASRRTQQQLPSLALMFVDACASGSSIHTRIRVTDPLEHC